MTRIGIVQDYAMYGHFLDIKQAYITGMYKALMDYDLSAMCLCSL